jgi:4-hydroxyphenylpyruvate dioxygenase-like putative hemolysin
MMQTPDGNGRLELTKFHSPPNRGDNRHAPANTQGIRHVAFAVEDIDAVVAGLRARGAETRRRPPLVSQAVLVSSTLSRTPGSSLKVCGH